MRREKDAECQHRSQPVLNCFTAWQHLVIMKARLRLAEDKLDELVELFSEHIEGIRADVTRYGTKETKCKKQIGLGLHTHYGHDDWLSGKKDLQIGTNKIRTDTSVRVIRTKRPLGVACSVEAPYRSSR